MRRGCCRSSGATATSKVLIPVSVVFKFILGEVQESADELIKNSLSKSAPPCSGSHPTFSELFEDEGAELCEDRASAEKTEDVDEDAEEAIDEA